MKTTLLFAVAGMFLASSVLAQESADWSAKSTEKQFDKTSSAIYKHSKNDKAKTGNNTQARSTGGVDAKASSRQTEKAKLLTTRAQSNSINSDFWVYDAHVTYRTDNDFDGYFNHFTLEFDADTEFVNATVYARLYLARGDVFKEYHTTSDFTIYGDSNTDSFVVESELLSGFPSDEYEVLIELYDAYNDELVATWDGTNDADLYLLSLESLNFETVYEEPQVVVVHESGGSAAILSLLLLPLVVIRKYYNRHVTN